MPEELLPPCEVSTVLFCFVFHHFTDEERGSEASLPEVEPDPLPDYKSPLMPTVPKCVWPAPTHPHSTPNLSVDGAAQRRY